MTDKPTIEHLRKRPDFLAAAATALSQERGAEVVQARQGGLGRVCLTM